MGVKAKLSEKTKTKKRPLLVFENIEETEIKPPKTKRKAVLEPPKPSVVLKSNESSKKSRKTQKNVIEPVTEISSPETGVAPKKSKKKRFHLPSKAVSEELVSQALKALQKLDAHHKEKSKIFEDESQVFLQINAVKIQNTRVNIRFTLPHSTVASTGEVCLITPDIKKGRKHDHEPTIDKWDEMLKEAGVTEVKTIMPMRQLRVEYDQFELKRRLLTQHDFIMVDSRVLSHVSHLLGKKFFKKHNMLIPVRLHEVKDIKKIVQAGLRTSMLRMNEGATSTMLVGHMGMPVNKIKENILSLLKQFQEKFPGGEINIRSLMIKLPLSLALPIYVTLRPKSSVQAPRIHSSVPKEHQIVEDELSTIPGSTVKVTPQGTVIVNRNALKETKDQPEIESDGEIEEETASPKTAVVDQTEEVSE